MQTEDEMRAAAVGLQKAWRDHPADVREAIAHAKRLAGAFVRPVAPGAEPIPPYAAIPMPAAAPKRAKGGQR